MTVCILFFTFFFYYLIFSMCLVSNNPIHQVHAFTAPSRRRRRNSTSTTRSPVVVLTRTSSDASYPARSTTSSSSSSGSSSSRQIDIKCHASVNPNTSCTADSTTATTTSSNNNTYKVSLSRIVLTIASTYYTWHAQKNFSNVMASSATTLLCTMMTNNKSIHNAVFCGTFAGMSSKAIIPSWNYALLLGTITSVFYEGMIQYKNQFVGLGGRLGLVAFVSTWMVVAFIKWTTAAAAAGGVVGATAAGATAAATGGGAILYSFPTLIKKINTSNILFMVFWHMVGSILTIALRRTSDETRAVDPVRAASVVGMAGSLFLFLLLPRRDDVGKTAVLALYGGSFVGMSAPSRLLHGVVGMSGGGGAAGSAGGRCDDGVVQIGLAFGIAAALAGVVHGLTMDWGLWMGGWGGKAGACAFVGCVLYRCLVTCLTSLVRVGRRRRRRVVINNSHGKNTKAEEI